MAIRTFTAAGQNAFTTATRVYGPIISYPYPRDLTLKTITEKWWITATSFSPLALDTAHGTISGAYLVGESDFVRMDGGILEWTRTYSTVGATRSDPNGTYAFPFPGLPTGSIDATKTITSISNTSGADPYLINPTFTVSTHGYSVGDLVFLSLVYTSATTASFSKITAITTNTFTTQSILLFIDRSSDGSGTIGTWSSGTSQKSIRGRSQSVTLPADSIAIYSYALPGVTSGISTASDFIADDRFRPLDLNGDEVSILDATSTPTASDYRLLIRANSYIVADSAISIYMGNILQKKTLMVLAK